MAEALDPVIPDDVEALAQAVLAAACDAGRMLATAESCTGGLLASLLTDIPGKSHAFERGFVTYSNDAKHDLLGVPCGILDGEGPVSEACARAMAEGALDNARADVAISVTGYTEGAPDAPAGLVHFAVAVKGGSTRHCVERYGDIGRAAVRVAALRTALRMLSQV